MAIANLPTPNAGYGGPNTLPMPGGPSAALNSGMKGGGDWFAQNAPPAAPTLADPAQGTLNQQYGNGAPGGGYGGQFQAPQLNNTNDPGYQFRLDQAGRAYQNSAFARGQGLTGGSLRGLTDYIGNAASQEYGNVFARQLAGDTFNRDTSFGNQDRALNSYIASRDTFWGDNDRLFGRNFSLASLGQNAAAGYGNQLGAYGNNISDLYTNQGNANAGRAIGVGNAISGGIAGGVDAYGRRR